MVKEFPEPARKLAAAYWPGPLTMVLPKSELVPMETSGGLSTVAVRLPAHPVANRLIRACGCRQPRPPETCPAQPHHGAALCSTIWMAGLMPFWTASPLRRRGKSTVRPWRNKSQAAAPEQRCNGNASKGCQRRNGRPAVLHKLAEALGQRRSMKYKHYAPKAKVILVRELRSSTGNLSSSKRAPE